MIHFQLVSSGGTKFDGEAHEVLVPTQGGMIAMFKDHMPLIAAATPGIVRVRIHPGDSDSAMKHFAVTSGVIQVDGKVARFISDEVTTSDEISEQEAAEALARAKELISKATGRVELDQARRVLQHRSAQLHVAKLKRRHHN